MVPGRDLHRSTGPSTVLIRVKLPEEFDPARHMGGLAKKIAEKHGEGFEIDSTVDGYAVATRQVAVTEIVQKRDVRDS